MIVMSIILLGVDAQTRKMGLIMNQTEERKITNAIKNLFSLLSNQNKLKLIARLKKDDSEMKELLGSLLELRSALTNFEIEMKGFDIDDEKVPGKKNLSP